MFCFISDFADILFCQCSRVHLFHIAANKQVVEKLRFVFHSQQYVTGNVFGFKQLNKL